MASKGAGRGGGARGGVKPPDGRVRPSQCITTYGPGAMVDLLHDAVLVGGLEFWSRSGRQGFDEPRLRARLRAQFPELDEREPFSVPPVGDDRRASSDTGIEVLEFPRHFVCQRPNCRRVVRVESHTPTKAGRYVHVDCGGYLAPVRFVTACPRGHIDDFPWTWFAHAGEQEEGKGPCVIPDVKLNESATGDFAELTVVCESCGRTRPMIVAKTKGTLGTCNGRLPWLGHDEVDPDGCNEDARLLLRTASNSYFAEVVSSLEIPEPLSAAYLVEKHASDFTNIKTLRQVGAFRELAGAHLAELFGTFSDEEIFAELEAKRSGKTIAKSDPSRTAEYKLFISQPEDKPGDYPSEAAPFYARTAPSGDYPAGVSRVVLAHRLREVRVQTGFTRFEARTPDLQGEYPEAEDLGLRPARLATRVRWLPGVEVRGEGFLLQLDEDALREWESRREVQGRIEDLYAGYRRWADMLERNKRTPPKFYGPRFYLLHSLSHLLIQAVSLECGYSASSIRERIYCSRPEDKTQMAGILFSTGTTGSEGTLGGLLEQGRAVREHLRRAFDMGTICSNDPVCAAHTPARDPTERFLQGAACHGCLFIAEPSCEHFNRFLDRALVFPTLGHDGVAFFRTRP
ncbi:MAG TPA: DUF1998 domain-containing protein [Labilithrix sp.]|nr:DUF1998 domain-containing protein [Labilithrix sp.]